MNAISYQLKSINGFTNTCVKTNENCHNPGRQETKKRLKTSKNQENKSNLRGNGVEAYKV